MTIDPGVYGLIGGVGMFLTEALICYKALRFEPKCMALVWCSACVALIIILGMMLSYYHSVNVTDANRVLYEGFKPLVIGVRDQIGLTLLTYSILTWSLIGFQVYKKKESEYYSRYYN
ncbi:hypothetical protein R7Q39_22020 [Vibrio sp. 947]|uniref:hypothetical protein n=1 Tax=unclassified Vibrio TaxID=2614977 RepID=UPI0029642B20|nr:MULTISPECIES: hypothetical protein [unclassified Vibrio]MDW1583489.1 hypothetical protein [Vibrio sp. Vb2897]MDW1641907.1 hypothetical protein [Vibrio sp. Vb2896]MDW1928082.1 hypothetical protein [Vibrio sp. 947]